MNQEPFTAQVNAGCLLFIHRDCLGQLQEDTSDCLLYTQLAATKKHDRFNAADDWNNTWLAAMNRFGYSLKSTESLSLPSRDMQDKTVWQWIDEHLPRFVSPALFSECESLAKRSFAAFPDQPAFQLLARQTLQPVAPGDHPAGHCQQKTLWHLGMLDAGGALSLVTLGFTSRTALGADYLFQTLAIADVKGNIEMRFQSMRMMDVVYGSLRNAVRRALEDKRTGLSQVLETGASGEAILL
jgi:hypothetical protein